MCFKLSNNKNAVYFGRGSYFVKKNEMKNPTSFEFNEQGAMEVNELIMDSYNIGFIDQDEENAGRSSIQSK